MGFLVLLAFFVQFLGVFGQSATPSNATLTSDQIQGEMNLSYNNGTIRITIPVDFALDVSQGRHPNNSDLQVNDHIVS
jgi:hypothetical protein